MDGADPSPPTICQLSGPQLFYQESSHAISRRIDRPIVIGIIVGILVGNVRSAVNAIIIQETIGF